MDNDILRKVDDSELKDVLKALKKDWPKHFLLHQHVAIMDEYKQSNVKSPKQSLYVYGSYEDGFYVMEITFFEVPMTNYFLYSPAEDLSALPSVLARSRRIPWFEADGGGGDRQGRFPDNISRFTPAVLEAAGANGVERIIRELNFTFWVPPDQPFDYGDLPDDLYMDYLKESDAASINESWVCRSPGSEGFLATQIRNNFGIGLYRKGENKLLAHSISFHSGGIFALATLPEERKKGYAEIVVRNMVKELRKRGRIPFGAVQCRNVPSQRLFLKLGFKHYSTADYIAF